jgi:hypothetical protein
LTGFDGSKRAGSLQTCFDPSVDFDLPGNA